MSPKKEPTYLITSSVLDSFNWLQNCPPSWKDRAYGSLVSTIKREPWSPTGAIKRGIEFENMLYQKARSIVNNEGSPAFKAIVDKIKGGRFQSVLKKEIDHDGMRVVLYGKVDVLFEDKITDVKTTENYRGDDKYLNGWQHKLYTYMSGLETFDYLVVLFKKYPSMEIKDVFEIPYTNDKPEDIRHELRRGIRLFHDWLHDENLFHDYDQTFSNNGRRR